MCPAESGESPPRSRHECASAASARLAMRRQDCTQPCAHSHPTSCAFSPNLVRLFTRIRTHDQIQGVVNVNVPVRQTVVKCGRGRESYLWVHNPVAPTGECIKMMRVLEAKVVSRPFSPHVTPRFL